MKKIENDALLTRTGGRRRRAFTMAEVMITIVIAVFIILASISLMIFNGQYLKHQQLRSGAMTVAAKNLEELQKTAFNQLVGSSERVVIDDGRTPDDPEDDVGANLLIEIKDMAGNLMAGPPTTSDRVEVCITVTWMGAGTRSTREFKESLVTYITP